MNTNLKWVTWDQAAITALLSFVMTIILRRLPSKKWRTRIIPAITELSLISALYTLWRLAMKLPLDQPSGAIERARQINRFQNWLHLPAELSSQHCFASRMVSASDKFLLCSVSCASNNSVSYLDIHSSPR